MHEQTCFSDYVTVIIYAGVDPFRLSLYVIYRVYICARFKMVLHLISKGQTYILGILNGPSRQGV